MTTAIVVAAGKGSRMGGAVDKAFLTLGSRPVVAHALAAFERCPDVSEVVLVVRKDQLSAADSAVRMFGLRKVRRIVAGGATRLASVRAGIAAANPDTTYFAVHDGARPAVPVALVRDCVASARKFGSGVAAAKITDTVKSVSRAGVVESTPERAKLWEVQTPQGFRRDILEEAYRRAEAESFLGTDDAGLVERLGLPVRVVEGSYRNIKVTTPEDLWVVETFMQRDIVRNVKARMESAGEDIDAALDGLDAFADKLAATVSEKIRAYRNKGEKK